MQGSLSFLKRGIKDFFRASLLIDDVIHVNFKFGNSLLTIQQFLIFTFTILSSAQQEEEDPFDEAFDLLAKESINKFALADIEKDLNDDDLFDTTRADVVLNLASIANVNKKVYILGEELNNITTTIFIEFGRVK